MREIVYDDDPRRKIDPAITGSAAAIISNMVARTKDFDIGNPAHLELVSTAIKKIVPVWTATVARACHKHATGIEQDE